MKLYRVRTEGMNFSSSIAVSHGDAYVVADSMDEAYAKLRKYLDTKELGATKDRVLDTIQLLAEEGDYPECRYRLFL